MKDIFHELCEQITTHVVEAINNGVSQALENNKLKSTKPILELLTKKEAAKFLGVSLPTLDKLIESGAVISHRIGGNIRLKKHELESALTQRKFSKFKTGGINGK